jgi:hypothetical protein
VGDTVQNVRCGRYSSKCKIRGYLSGDAEDSNILGSDAMSLGVRLLTISEYLPSLPGYCIALELLVCDIKELGSTETSDIAHRMAWRHVQDVSPKMRRTREEQKFGKDEL